MSVSKAFEADLWVLFKPAPDVPGQWIGHCLTLDVMSQGNDLKHAMHMLSEAIAIAICEDLANGANPIERGKSVPREDWDEFLEILKKGRPLTIGEAKGELRAIVAQAHFSARRRHSTKEVDLGAQTPAWMIGSIDRTRQNSINS